LSKINEAIKFHGHLGPYLILGILAGELSLKKVGAKKYFGLEVKVYGADQKPKSCLIDGLQLSTGATFGKGNILKFKGSKIKILVCNLKNNKKLEIFLKPALLERLNALKGHRDSEVFARKILRENTGNLFRLLKNL
jgi:formylmethanofuran dehydrogenase subunit E